MAESTKLRIPPPLQPVLRDVASLSDSDFDALVEALRAYEGSGPDELASYLAEQLSLPRPDAEQLVRLVISLESVRESNEWTPEEAGSEVSSAEGSPAESDDDRTEIARRVEQLLGLDSIAFAARVGHVLYANESTWRTARFLTDIRGVFGEDALELQGAVVVTNLEISYIASDGRTRRTYFALDDNDLDDLARDVRLARERSAALQQHLDGVGIRVASTSADEKEAQRGQD
jgi:hypothetical protein